MFKLVRKRSKSTDTYFDEDELSAGLDRRGSEQVRSLFEEYQATRSNEAIERLREQVRKELRRWTPIRIAFYVALAIAIASAVSVLSFVFLRYVIHGGASSDHRKPTATASASLRPTGRSVGDLQVSPTATPAHKSNRKDLKRNQVSGLATPDTSNFTEPPKAPSACASCSVPGLSQSVGEAVGAVQNVLKPVVGVASGLIQFVGQAIAPTSLIPGSPAPAIPTLISPNDPVP